jgi:ankyrin repeat protein
VRASQKGVSAILIAVYYRRPEIAGIFVEHGAKPDIFEACALGSADRVRELLDAQPDLTKTYAPDGFTPLGLAAYFGHLDAVKLLVARGADVNAPSNNAQKVPPLVSAAAGKHEQVVRLLLESGANPNAFEKGGETALHAAAFGGHEGIVRLLLERGADRRAKMDDGMTAEALARAKGHAALAEILK